MVVIEWRFFCTPLFTKVNHVFYLKASEGFDGDGTADAVAITDHSLLDRQPMHLNHNHLHFCAVCFVPCGNGVNCSILTPFPFNSPSLIILLNVCTCFAS